MPVYATALVAGALTFAFRYLAYSGFPNDHFVHLATAQQLLGGALPVRDFVERGTPLMEGVSAGAQLAFGPGLQSELVLVAAGFAGAAVLLFLLAASASGSLVVAAITTATAVVVFPTSYAYPKHLVYAFGLWIAWLYGLKPTRIRLVALAAAVAAAFLFRHDHGVLLACGVLAFLAVRHGRVGALPRAAGFALALLLCILPYLAWVQRHEGLAEYVRDGIAFSRRESERSAWRPPPFALDRSKPLVVRAEFETPVVNVRWRNGLAPRAVAEREAAHRLTRVGDVGPLTWQYELSDWSRQALALLVSDPAAADTQGIDRREFSLTEPPPFFAGWPLPGPGLRARDNAVTALFYVVWALPVMALALVGLLSPDSRRAWLPFTVMAAVTQLAMNVTMLRDPFDLRIRDVLVPASLLSVIAASALWYGWRASSMWFLSRAAAVVTVAGLFVLCALVGSVDEQLDHINVAAGVAGVTERFREIQDELAPPRERIGRVDPSQRALVEYLVQCTTPTSRIFALTFAPELFFYAERGFAAGQVTLTPGYYVTPRHAALMVDRLSKENVPLVVLDRETRSDIVAGYPAVMAYVTSRYAEAGRFVVRGKELILLAEHGRLPVRAYGSSRLPCYAQRKQNSV